MPSLAEIFKKAKAQNFGPQDSQIVSTLMHPGRGLGKFGEYLQQQATTAAGMPQNQDEASMYAYAPSQEQQAGAANNLTGMMQTGAMPFAPRSAGGTLGTFVGPKSQGWSDEAAAQATKLLDEGVDPAQVWKQHLIGRMPDKSLFSEIDDSGADFGGLGFSKLQKGTEDALPLNSTGENQVFSHDDFAKHYPDLYKNLDVSLWKDSTPGGHFFGNSDYGQIRLNTGNKTREKLTSTGLHELQHAIQDREGWARGGNPTDINLDEFAPLRQKEYNDIGDLLLPDTMARYRASTSQAEKDAILAERKGLMARQHKMSKQNPDEIAFELYQRLTGEAQARATQDRMGFNMDERRNIYPLAGDRLSDIPLKDLINRYR
jgi:hypothetical protein